MRSRSGTALWRRRLWAVAVLFILVAAFPDVGLAIDAKTVPFDPNNLLIPHDSWSGKQITLKGASDVEGPTIQYTWDFGDGSPAVAGTVTNRFVIEAAHVYTGAVGTVFTATLTVTDGSATDRANYYVRLNAPPPNLPVEVNVAIDEGLWYLHKTQVRYVDGETGLDFGDWTGGGYASSGNISNTAANINAFEVNGHRETGSPADPYTYTVARAMRYLFSQLVTAPVFNQTNGLGTFNPDANGNGFGVTTAQGMQLYQGGMIMDAIISSGTPIAVTPTGPLPSGTDPGVRARTYKAIVQDMADYYGFCEYDSDPVGGGWRYVCNEAPDNSVGQWAAIGLIAAERVFGVVVPSMVKSYNEVWLLYTQAPDGSFGYTNTWPAWGPYATTPSGGVQMAMDGIGRGDPRWDAYETFMRNNFGNTGGPYNSVRDYYYGLFSFTKSMLLHDSNGDGTAEPITMLHSTIPGVPDVDWYAAQTVSGDPLDGVARTLVSGQDPGGYWWGHDPSSAQSPFETAWAIIMLRRTVIETRPVAVPNAIPNPALAGETVTFDGTASYHPDAARKIVLYEWDFNNDGTYDASGPIVTYAFGTLGTYPVTLRVTDDNASPLSDTKAITVNVTVPPVAPTANAGGPYMFCMGRTPWLLNGAWSVNPDDGIRGAPGAPPDRMTLYGWDFDGDRDFDDVLGAVPDVTAYYGVLGAGDYLVQLMVADNTALSFPYSGLPNLSDTASAEIRVRLADAPECLGPAAPALDIKPGSFPNSINPKSQGKIPVAILSSPAFDAPSIVKTDTLKFGRTGTEMSLVFCSGPADINGDGRQDLVCHFLASLTGFKPGDTKGILTGLTNALTSFVLADSVRILGK